VRREGLRAFRGPAGGVRSLAGARARLDPADARRHPAVDGRLHDRHRRLLFPRRRCAPRYGTRARRERHDPHSLEALPLFYLGASVTLYGTIFAATAAHSRVYADLCRLLGLFERDDYAARVRYRRGFLVLLTVYPASLFLLFESPVKMVVAGGIVQALLLPIAGLGTIYLHHRHVPQALRPHPAITVALWLSTAVMAVAGAYAVMVSLAR